MLVEPLTLAREAGTSFPRYATTLSLVGAMWFVSCPAFAVDRPLFTAPYLTYDTGGSPASVAVADMNRDGFQDLIIANSVPGNISILYGDGTGGFGDRTEHAVGATPCFVTTADLDSNGAPDLVVANGDGNSVSVLLGNGDGTFASRTDFATATGPCAVAIGDLNRDGWQDLAVAASGEYPAYHGQVSVLLGDGTGSFGNHADYPVDSSAVWVAIGDLNDDQEPDLAVANWYAWTFSVLIANGDGTFAPRTDYKVGGFPSSLAIEDWSGDGKADLAVAIYGLGDRVEVQLGNGDGSLQQPINYETGHRPQTLTPADVNGDGFRDFVVANVFSNSATILMGRGDGTFGKARQIDLPYGPLGLAIGELNGDGHPDLAVAHGMISKVVSVVLSNAGGLASSTPTYLTAGPVSVAVGDLDGDGARDVAAATIAYDYDDNEIGAVEIRLGNGDGTFRSGASYATAHAPSEVEIVDLNRDGRLDLAVANGVVSVFLGRGDGTFFPRNDIVSGPGASSLAIGDLNGDGRPDMVTAGQGPAPYSAGQLSVHLGNGDGSFGPPSSFDTGRGPRSVVLGDLNGDAKPDVVTADYGYGVGSDSVSVLLGHGDGTLGPRLAYGAGRLPTSVAMGDLDGDGKPDLAVANNDSRSVSVLRGAGDGTFTSRVDYPMGSELVQVSIADLDRDGRLDLISADSQYSATVSVRLGTPGGTLGNRIGYGVGMGFLSMAVADLNGDAMPDLVVSNQDLQWLSVLKSLAGPPTSTLLTFFEAAWDGERVEVRWQFQAGSNVAATTLERAESPDGPWTQIVGARRAEGEAEVLVDAGVEPGHWYTYRLVARLASGEIMTFGPVSTSGEPRAAAFALMPVAPNPAHGSLQLLFAMPHAAPVRISVLDVMGRRTVVLVDETLPAGRHEVAWEAPGGSAPAPAGVYFVRFEWPGGGITRRVAILKP